MVVGFNCAFKGARRGSVFAGCLSQIFLIVSTVQAVPDMIAPLPPVTGTVAGAIAGQFDVSPMGAATYTVPLSIPPGTAGMQPQLSIVYDSGAGSGILGTGFSLSGLSAVTRCPTTIAQDGFIDGVNFNANDRFCLDGQKLIAVQGVYGANETEYRTENESYARIFSYGQTGSGPNVFVVQLKNGQVYEYGNTDDSRLQAQSQPSVISWLVNKVSDRQGNYYSVQYQKDIQNGENILLRIDYTGNTNQGLAPYNSIQFTYADRPVPFRQYLAGVYLSSTKLLTITSMYTDNNLAWRYFSGFGDPDPLTQESRLSYLTECGGPGSVCLPGTVFYWVPTSTSSSAFASSTALSDLSPAQGFTTTGEKPFITGDWNGDGKTDIARDTGTTVRAFVSGDNGFTAISGPGNLGLLLDVNADHPPNHPYRPPTPLQTGDWNGDGLTDIVRITNAGQLQFLVSTGTGITPFVTMTHVMTSAPNGGGDGVSVTNNGPFVVGDWNGDGRSDFAKVFNGGVTFYVSNGTSFVWQSLIVDMFANWTPESVIPSNFTGDWNGDGLTDYAISTEVSTRFYVSTGTGFVLLSELYDFMTYSQGYQNTIQYPFLTGDWNGDGITDIARVSATAVRFCNTKGNGQIDSCRELNNFSPAQNYTDTTRHPIFTGDWNGDGTTDIARVSVTGIDFYYAKANSFIGPFTLPDFAYSQGYTSNDTYPISLGDWNGDGLIDIARVSSNSVQFYNRSVNPTMLLNNIIDGFGKRIQISYESLANTSLYTKGSGAIYPTVDLKPALKIVSNVATSDGLGDFAWQFYKYIGLRADLNGRGFSGFQKIQVQDYETGIKTITFFRQDFPHKGYPYKVEQRLSNNTLISSKEDTWTFRNVQYPSGASTYFPYVSQSVEDSYELNGSFVKNVSTNNTFDIFGNLQLTVVSRSDGSSETSTTYFNNDTSNWLIGQVGATQVTKVGPGPNPSPAVTRNSSFNYFSDGRLRSENVEPGNSAFELTKVYDYDAYGNIIRTTVSGPNVESRVSSSNYDSRGQFPIQTTDALGHSESRAYDPRHGRPIQVTDVNGLVTQWTYDSFGRVTNEYRPDGTTSRTVYFQPQSGNLGSTAYFIRNDSSGSAPTITYFDLLGREIRKEVIGFDGRKVFIDKVYDDKGRLSHVSDPYFEGDPTLWNASEYDALGRLTRVIAPGNRQTLTSYNGLTTVITNSLGQTSTQTMDTQGRVISTKDNLNNILTFRYDSVGNLVEVRDPAANLTTMQYDLRGNRTRLVDPDSGTTTYVFDAYGQVQSQTNAKGQVVSFLYDKLGRMLQKNTPEGISYYSYDTAFKGIGKPAREVGLGGYEVNYTYDNFGRSRDITRTINGSTYTTSQSYDQYSRPKYLTYPSGFSIQYSYNALGYLFQVRRVDTGLAYWTADAKNARGQYVHQTLGNGVSILKGYDSNTGLIQNIQSGNVQDLRFQFDALGNLTQRQDLHVNTSESFLYDGLNRLTQSQVLGQSPVTTTYDNLGNILSRSYVGNYIYGENNAGPHAVTRIVGSLPNTYGYDAAGNRTASIGGSTAYNSTGKPISIVSGNTELRFALDASDNRVEERTFQSGQLKSRKVVIGALYERIESAGLVEQIHYISGGDGPVAVYTTSIKQKVTKTKGPQLFDAVSLILATDSLSPTSAFNLGKTRYLLTDHLGSIQTILDDQGAIVEVSSFDSWGKRRDPVTWAPVVSNLSSEIDRGFTGHEQLDQVSLIHMNGRVYDPIIGRFLSADPYVQSAGNLQSLNRYSYVLNNPLSLTDPTGYFSFHKLFKGIGHFLKRALPVIAPLAAAFLTAGYINLATGLATHCFEASTAAYLTGISGVGSGMAYSVVGTIVHGGSLGQGIINGLKGAPLNFLRAGIGFEIGEAFQGSNALGRAVAHGVSGGAFSVVSGGKFGSGFAGNFFSTYVESQLPIELKGPVSAMLIGGGASALSGGKFSEGAMAATFAYLYNKELHPENGQSRSLIDTIHDGLEDLGAFMSQFDPAIHRAALGLETVGMVWKPAAGLGALLDVYASIGHPPDPTMDGLNLAGEGFEHLAEKRFGPMAGTAVKWTIIRFKIMHEFIENHHENMRRQNTIGKPGFEFVG